MPSLRDAAVAMFLVSAVSWTCPAAPACPPEEKPSEADQPRDRNEDAWEAQFAPDPESPIQEKYAEAQKKRGVIEREMKLIRAKHFRNIRGTEMRQAGITKMKQFTEPVRFPSMLDIFGEEGPDVQQAMLDHFADLNLDEGDATITWAAIFGKDRGFRDAARNRILAKAQSNKGEVSNRVKSVIAIGLKKERTSEVVAAAELARDLRLFDAIPMMIAAQAIGQAGGSGGGGGGGAGQGEDGALAYIMVGRQVAFVSDLTPVVGDSAVAFDPTLSVATEGVVMRVIDAFVVTYRIEVHNALVGLANAGWDGRSTAPLGWNGRAWRRWYAQEFVPYRQTLASGAEQAPQVAAKK